MQNFEKTKAVVWETMNNEKHVLFYQIYVFLFIDFRGMQNKI